MTDIEERTIAEVVRSNHPTISSLVDISEQHRNFALSVISAAIADYLKFINRHNTMNTKQIAEMAVLILEDYPKLTLADIKVFFRMCKRSAFGELYDLNGATLFNWLNDYIELRSDEEFVLYQQQEREQRRLQEERERAEWELLTPEQKAEQQREIDEIIKRLSKRFSALG